MAGTVSRNSNEWVVVEDDHKLPQGFEDEKQGDQPSKDILRKLCEEPNQGRALKPSNYQGDYEGPDTDPDPPVQELIWHVFLAKVVQSLVIKQDRSCCAYDDKWTAREESKDDTTSTGHHQGLGDTNIIVSFFSHNTTESNSSRECSKVDKDGGSQALAVQAILDIREKLWISIFHVIDQSSKGSTSSLEWIPLGRSLIFIVTITTTTRAFAPITTSICIFKSLPRLPPLSHLHDLVDREDVFPVPVTRRKQHLLFLHTVGHIMESRIGHKGGKGSSNLVRVHVEVFCWSQQDEDEPDRQANLNCVRHHYSFTKSHKRNNRLVNII